MGDDDGTEYLLESKTPSEKSMFAAMESGKPVSIDKDVYEFLDDDPEDSDIW